LILGEFVPRAQAWAAARGWGGDQCHVYEQAVSGHVLLAHLSAWDSVEDAEEFFRAYATRTAKRYPNAPGRRDLPLTEHAYQTPDGETFIARRGERVLVIEGLPEEQRGQLPKLAAALWGR
jgi:hypothetical protein